MNYFKFLTVILSLVWFSLGRAELEETNKRFPLQIDANSIQHDDLNSVTKFIGNVVLVRGSLILKGENNGNNKNNRNIKNRSSRRV